MKYYITASFLLEAVSGDKNRRISIEKFLKNLIQDNHSLITSASSVIHLLESAGTGEVILHQLEILFDSILPVTLNHVRSSVYLQKETTMSQLQAVETVIAMEAGSTLIDNTEAMKSQKMVKVTYF